MSYITDLKSNITEQEVRYKSAVSESTFFKMGGSINFINNRLHLEKKWAINGFYPAAGYVGVDGLTLFEYDVEIFGCYMYNLTQGSGGTTEIDIKKITSQGATPISIFSQRPRISFGAGDNAWINDGGSFTGCVAPVFSITTVLAGQALKCDLITGQTGGKNCGIVLFYRPT